MSTLLQLKSENNKLYAISNSVFEMYLNLSSNDLKDFKGYAVT